MSGPESSITQDEGESDIPDGELELGSGINTDIGQAFAGTLIGNSGTIVNTNIEGMDD